MPNTLNFILLAQRAKGSVAKSIAGEETLQFKLGPSLCCQIRTLLGIQICQSPSCDTEILLMLLVALLQPPLLIVPLSNRRLNHIVGMMPKLCLKLARP
jgi:hypothetical protein